MIFDRYMHEINDLVEFQQDLAGDLDVILLDVLQRDNDAFVEADV